MNFVRIKPLCVSILFLTLIILVPALSLAQKNKLNFESISIEQGLSQSSVHCIAQDQKGFMWFGTLDGLNRYDGFNIKIYRNAPDDSTTLSDNYITSLFVDKQGLLWVGTKSRGLSILDKYTDTFINMPHIDGNEASLSNNYVKSICEDGEGDLWIATEKGLNRYNREYNNFTRYYHNPEDSTSIPDNNVNVAYCDDMGRLWIGTASGLCLYNPLTNNFTGFVFSYDQEVAIVKTLFYKNNKLWIGTRAGVVVLDEHTNAYSYYKSIAGSYKTLSNDRINAITADNRGDIWVGTENGLNKFDESEDCFLGYRNDFESNSLSVDYICTLYLDRTGILWVGKSLGGANKWNRYTEAFSLYRHNPYDTYSLSSGQVRSLYIDKEEKLWVGTVEGGLNWYDKKTNRFYSYTNNPKDTNSLTHNHVRAILEDSYGNFWVGTNGGGLDKFNPTSERFTHYVYDEGNANSISHNRIWKIIETKDSLLWIATDGGGLNQLNPQTMKFWSWQNIPGDNKSLSCNNTTSLCEDKFGVIWVGTFGGGLNSFDRNTGEFTHYVNNPEDSMSLSNNRIYNVYEDSEGVLWIGTKGDLNRYNRQQNNFTSFGEKDGLPNNVIMGIIDDDEGNLWLTTNRGISKFNKKELSFRNYDVRDGLQNNEFLVGSYYKSRDGAILFGGINGFNSFYAKNIKDNPHIPEIVITRFQIFNKDVAFDTVISEKKELHLSWTDDVFSFEYIGLNYIFPEKNQYAYKMEGVDKIWNHVGNRRYISYTNVPPGKYIFRVKGSNNDGVWNELGTSIRVIIDPPFWETTWFRILAGLLIILIVFSYIKLRERKLLRDKKILEQKVIERTAEIVKQKNEIELKNTELQKQKSEIQEQRDHITEIHQEITDSIHYAERIQRAILPTLEFAATYLADHFILFKPKDIVSGDFYWMTKIRNYFIITAADCTGHGVPGAFMSMLGVSFLNEIVTKEEVTQACDILNELRMRVISSLQQKGISGEQKDGMDMGLAILNMNNNEVQFSGANNPLYILRRESLLQQKDTIEDIAGLIEEVKPDKMPIAIYVKMDDFTNHTIRLDKGDCFYMFSDGYADQFGGAKAKKFKYKPFKRMLAGNFELTMDEQKNHLEAAFNEWTSYTDPDTGRAFEQIDDIVIVGVKV